MLGEYATQVFVSVLIFLLIPPHCRLGCLYSIAVPSKKQQVKLIFLSFFVWEGRKKMQENTSMVVLLSPRLTSPKNKDVPPNECPPKHEKKAKGEQ